MNDLPRFPQPMIDWLLECSQVHFHDILSLVSVDKRERPMRRFVIRSACLFNATLCDDIESFLDRYHPLFVLFYAIDELPADLIDVVTHLRIVDASRLAHLPTRALQLCVGGGVDNAPLSHLKFPASLRELTFAACFNHALRFSFPQNLRRLEFGADFNQPIECLRDTNVVELYLNGSFTHSIDTALPATLQILEIRDGFNLSLERVCWPQNLRQLDLGNAFNRPITRVRWPASLTRLSFGFAFNKTLRGAKWPASLERLRLGWSFSRCQTLAAGDVPESVALDVCATRPHSHQSNATTATKIAT